MSKKAYRLWRKDNRGASIVTVMVVTVFVSIMATTLLYISAMNVRVKQVDYQNKTSFYEGETSLEEMKALFVKDASVAYEAAYKAVMVEYASLHSVQRDELYKKKYVQKIKSLWENRKPDAATTNLEVLRDHFGLTTASSGQIVSVGTWDYDESNGSAVLRDVRITYTDVNGFTTMLQTDFYLEAPSMDWSMNSSSTWYSGVADERDTVQVEEFVVFHNWQKQQ